MRALALLGAALVAGAAPAQAQQAPVRPDLKISRPDEDWRPLCADPGLRDELLDSLKCVDLGDGTTLTLGGDVRARLEWSDEPAFGRVVSRDHAQLFRAYLHADLRVTDRIRVFGQVAYAEQTGREGGPGPFDVDRLDLAQGFVDLSAPWGSGTATARLGRQEFNFGSGRLISSREGANVRLAADAFRLTWRSQALRVDGFYAQPVRTARGSFDDTSSTGQAIWGVYATGQLTGALQADLYYLGYRNVGARYASGPGIEERHSIGARAFGASRRWDWDLEAVFQLGTFGDKRIRAWTIASDTGLTLELPTRPRIALKADVASGDHDPEDRRLGTFNALYPRLPYFSDANLVAPANFYDLQPYLKLSPTPRLGATLGWNILWRESMRDAVYVPPGVPYPGTAGRAGRRIGSQLILGANWQVTRHVDVASRFVHFWTGEVLRAAGGADVDFLFTSIAWKF